MSPTSQDVYSNQATLSPDPHSKPFQTSEMELFVNIVNG